jgi:predicted GTPase
MGIFKVSEGKVQEMLDQLADVREKEKALLAVYAQKVADDPELQQIQQFVDEQAEQADKLLRQIKTAVLKHGETIKGARLQAVWAKGRTGWDTQGLIGFAVAHPEMEQFKTVGKPTVSIRKA